MACNYPIQIKDPKKYTDLNPVMTLVPCGKCLSCVQRKRADWSFRLNWELKESPISYFVTLTFSDKYVPQKLSKHMLQNYFKRIRKKNKGLKYYAVAEYGTRTKRPHFHVIAFNASAEDLAYEWRNIENNEELGFVDIGQVTEASIHYVTGYVIEKMGEIDGKTGKAKGVADKIRPFAQMSKGLGKIFLKHNAKIHKSNLSTKTYNDSGMQQLLPRYYREKIFDENDKEVLTNIHEREIKILMEKIRGDPELIQKEFRKRKQKIYRVKNPLKNKKL